MLLLHQLFDCHRVSLRSLARSTTWDYSPILQHLRLKKLHLQDFPLHLLFYIDLVQSTHKWTGLNLQQKCETVLSRWIYTLEQPLMSSNFNSFLRKELILTNNRAAVSSSLWKVTDLEGVTLDLPIPNVQCISVNHFQIGALTISRGTYI